MSDMTNRKYSGMPEKGAFRDLIRASNRRLFWEEICGELIDNALEHSRDSVRVVFDWDVAKKQFTISDNGIGASDVSAFVKPGKSAPTGREYGNSTFGMGLYVIECCLSSSATETKMEIATRQSGANKILLVSREIQKNDEAIGGSMNATKSALEEFGIVDSGTRINFTKISKTMPVIADIDRVSKKLGRAYGNAINTNVLEVTLTLNGESTTVVPEQTPKCLELKEDTINVDGHSFRVVWGVTTEVCRDNACRLIYGGKYFADTKEPCGDSLLDRFFASIFIPRTIGRQSMDVLKRGIEHESIDSLYDKLAETFMVELEASTDLCSDSQSVELSESISSLLSCSLSINPKGELSEDVPETRDYNGREVTSPIVKTKTEEDVSTKQVRKKRRGRKKLGIPNKLLIQWAPLGIEQGLAVYDDASLRVTFNLDIEVIQQLTQNNDEMQLASIAATHIAHDIESDEKQKQFGFSEQSFESIYRTMMERICNASKQ